MCGTCGCGEHHHHHDHTHEHSHGHEHHHHPDEGIVINLEQDILCLLYTSDAADD